MCKLFTRQITDFIARIFDTHLYIYRHAHKHIHTYNPSQNIGRGAENLSLYLWSQILFPFIVTFVKKKLYTVVLLLELQLACEFSKFIGLLVDASFVLLLLYKNNHFAFFCFGKYPSYFEIHQFSPFFFYLQLKSSWIGKSRKLLISPIEINI